MKILINTITPEERINAIEAADKAIADERGSVEFGGIEEAVEPSRELLEAKEIAEAAGGPVIADVVFPVGEWKHITDAEYETMKADLAKYPAIKEAHVVLEERMKAAIEEKGLTSFAEGIRQAADTYKQELPTIADTVLKIAPVPAREEIATEEVIGVNG